MVRKQDGMTLVEVLATLLLSSLFILLIWTTVAISMRYNIVETKKLKMQKEANYIITDIQRIHRSFECYQITTDDQGTWRSSKCSNGEVITIYSNSDYRYLLDGYPSEIYTKPIKDKEEDYSYELSVKIYELDNNNDNNPNLEVKTVISRYEENTREGD